MNGSGQSGRDLVQAVEDLVIQDPVAPADPNPANQLAVEVWKMELKEHQEKVQHYANFQAGLYRGTRRMTEVARRLSSSPQ